MITRKCVGSAVLIFLLNFFIHPAFGVTINVPSDQPTIQAGIDAAADGDMVLVAPGSYVENIDLLGKAISVTGAGADMTVIDGGQSGSVVTFANGETQATLLEGFTIRNGSGTLGTLNTHGGGIYCYSASPYVLKCTITENSADFGGGVECNVSTVPVLDQCTISDNIGTIQGGGVISFSSNTSIWYCTISGNSSGTDGGGIYADNSYVDIHSTTVSGNVAGTAGGGVLLYASSVHSVIGNCMILGNRAADGGGIVFNTSSPKIMNCTIAWNRATGEGGGIRCSSGSEASVRNCIFWGDSATIGPEIWIGATTGSSILTLDYSDVQGGQAAAHVASGCTLDWRDGNIDSDPLFIDPGAWDDRDTPDDPTDDVWRNGDHHLDSGSPCIDAGTEAIMITEDIDEGPRPLLNAYDMGATEYSGTCWDADGDGYADGNCGGDDCDGTNSEVNPGVEEICFNSIDDDCDGMIDSADPECVTIEVPGDQPNIQAAINAADHGNTIIVSSGTYVENINFFGKDITLRSVWGPGLTMIDGGAYGSVVSFVGGGTAAVLDGFEITNGFGSGAGYGGGVACVYASPTIRNCNIRGNFAAYGGGIDLFQSMATVESCMITENQAVYNGGGVGCERASPEIVNCTISENSAGRGGGIYAEMTSLPSLTNVILWGNTAYRGPEIWIGTMGNPSTVSVAFSDVEGGGEAVHAEPYCTLDWGEGNIDADPLFVNPWDFHLDLGSPCVDAGTDAGVNEDLDGDKRPLLTGHDIGADEFSGSCWDLDGDGYNDECCGGNDCDDNANDVNPGAAENCDNEIDNDCDGYVGLEDPDCVPMTTTTTLPPTTTTTSTTTTTLPPTTTTTTTTLPPTTTTTTLPPGPVEFTLELDASYTSGNLSLSYSIGTPEAASWANYLILPNPSVQVIPLWTAQLPAIDPPITIPLSFPFPSQGMVGIYTAFIAGGSPVKTKLIWVDTGTAG